jgi:hypothetical protein
MEMLALAVPHVGSHVDPTTGLVVFLGAALVLVLLQLQHWRQGRKLKPPPRE